MAASRAVPSDRPSSPAARKRPTKLRTPLALANTIPIKGGNVVNVVYDATALRMGVSYAKAGQEAYTRPYTYIDLKKIDADGNGKPDMSE